MAFDQPTRNRLAGFVGDCRTLLAEEFTRQLQSIFGMDPATGDVADLDSLTLASNQFETARLLRDTLEHYLASADTGTAAKAKKARIEVIVRIVREQAFTVLNRLCALRMSEARGLLVESIGKGYQSKGFQLYKQLAGTAMGETGDAYRCFLFSLFDEFAIDLPVLFDRFSPEGRLFPRETALLEVLEQVNYPEIDTLWAEDETIGWIYQYFNSVEERREMRAASQAPRNSRELAVRNQFFTPRYVVEFLTDNTLGRIWYEMTQGETGLKDSCRYLVRRPNEIFLSDSEEAPEQEEPAEELTQEELLKQPVHIPHRPLKDPRDIKMLDPACGSMHFGLYAFDLFERIYDEAWDLEAERGADTFLRPEGLQPLHETYDSKEAFLRVVPRLIIERNIHGIDIDPRAVQIAGLSLWLRAQRSWQNQDVKAQDRPQIQRSNIVCAEPMPGETDMLEEFIAQLQPKVLGQLVRIIFDKMKLAGEAGSLLKIEEEIQDSVAAAHQEYQEYTLHQKKEEGFLPGMAPKRDTSLFDFADLPKQDRFWHRAEALVFASLRAYAERAQGQDMVRRRMFAQDALQGFAFIDVCRRRYDVLLMNPPFGKPSVASTAMLRHKYPDNWKEVYAAFIERAIGGLAIRGLTGCISSSQFLYTKQMKGLRDEILRRSAMRIFVHLGKGILDDAAVDTGLSVLRPTSAASSDSSTMYLDLKNTPHESKNMRLLGAAQSHDAIAVFDLDVFRMIATHPFAFHAHPRLLDLWRHGRRLQSDVASVATGNHTFDDYRFVRLSSEIPSEAIGTRWKRFDKGGEYQPFYVATPLLVDWYRDGAALRAINVARYGTDAQVMQASKYWYRAGLCYSHVSSVGFGPRILPADTIFASESISIFCKRNNDRLPVLGVLVSTVAQDLIWVFGRYRKIENRAVSDLPIGRDELQASREALATLALRGVELVRQLEMLDEVSPLFLKPEATVAPGQNDIKTRCDIQTELKDLYTSIDEAVLLALGLSDAGWAGEARPRAELVGQFVQRCGGDAQTRAKELVSYLVGVAFGRWDARHAARKAPLAPMPDVFEALPSVAPGSVHADDTGSGQFKAASVCDVLVSDDGHPKDIAHAARLRMSEIWPQTADAVEQKTLQDLECVDLHTYLAKTSGFFDDHSRRYSKSRRCAPIYWPLSTPSGSYTLWLYYHRLTDQTLYTCVNDFVDPKLKQVSDEASRLRGKSNRSSAEEKELERLSDLELELKDFRDELLRVAKFWKPNLNDGVQITAAPLWKFFQHRQWQDRLKETWQKLEAGEYDWAHLALSIWPDRVARASHKDRSYAIAHDLENELWEEVEIQKKTRGGKVKKVKEWRPRSLTNDELDRIVERVKSR